MRTVKLKIELAHKGQESILDNQKRFNTVVCGRRFGKTTLGRILAKEAVIQGKRVGWFSPTYKDMSKVWKNVTTTLAPIQKSKDSTLKQFYSVTGGSFEGWSTDSEGSGRGMEYDIVIVDETQKHKRLRYLWQDVLFPTVTSTGGQIWFLGTIDQPESEFHNLFLNEGNEWGSFTMPTSANPFISQDEIDLAERTLDENTFAREYKALWVKDGDRSYFITAPFKHLIKPLEFDEINPIVLSFDNNVDPMSVLVSQHDYAQTWKKFMFEFQESNCDFITGFLTPLRHELERRIPNYSPNRLIVTGDPNCRNRNMLASGSISMFETIRNFFILADGQIKPVSHISHSNHKDYFNNSLVMHNIEIDEGCTQFIYDLEHAEVEMVITSTGKKLQLKKKNRKDKSQQLDLLDCGRYDLQGFVYGRV